MLRCRTTWTARLTGRKCEVVPGVWACRSFANWQLCVFSCVVGKIYAPMFSHALTRDTSPPKECKVDLVLPKPSISKLEVGLGSDTDIVWAQGKRGIQL